MPSKSTTIESRSPSYAHSVPSDKGTLPTSTRERDVRPLNPKLKCAIIAFAVGGVAGIILIGLAAAGTFGAVGSTGFIGSLAGGGAMTLFFAGGFIWMIILCCKHETNQRPATILTQNQGQPFTRKTQVEEESLSGSLEQKENEDTLLFYKENLKLSVEISKTLKEIPPLFFEDKSQERAKFVFSEMMQIDADVSFPKAGSIDFKNLPNDLDLSIFQLSVTQGVEKDIPNSSKDTQHVHIYQVASQYNAAEAPDRFTPSIGTAMESSKSDKTQGPLAQRTNPRAFECVTAFLTHLGFNMLDKVLPSAGQTYQKGAAIEHGYLCPTEETIEVLTQEFKENFSQAEYVCYPSIQKNWDGSRPVYIMLQAAPAIGYSRELNSPSDELQKYAALANFLALFRQGITLAKLTGKPVVLHATAVGGGVFRNATKNLQWGLTTAALALQKEMKNWEVTVQLEAFRGEGPLKEIANNLKIPLKARLGN